MKELNILFIGGGKRFSAAECFIDAGKKLGIDIRIFAYEMGFGLPIEKIATVKIPIINSFFITIYY